MSDRRRKSLADYFLLSNTNDDENPSRQHESRRFSVGADSRQSYKANDSRRRLSLGERYIRGDFNRIEEKTNGTIESSRSTATLSSDRRLSKSLVANTIEEDEDLAQPRSRNSTFARLEFLTTKQVTLMLVLPFVASFVVFAVQYVLFKPENHIPVAFHLYNNGRLDQTTGTSTNVSSFELSHTNSCEACTFCSCFIEPDALTVTFERSYLLLSYLRVETISQGVLLQQSNVGVNPMQNIGGENLILSSRLQAENVQWLPPKKSPDTRDPVPLFGASNVKIEDKYVTIAVEAVYCNGTTASHSENITRNENCSAMAVTVDAVHRHLSDFATSAFDYQWPLLFVDSDILLYAPYSDNVRLRVALRSQGIGSGPSMRLGFIISIPSLHEEIFKHAVAVIITLLSVVCMIWYYVEFLKFIWRKPLRLVLPEQVSQHPYTLLMLKQLRACAIRLSRWLHCLACWDGKEASQVPTRFSLR